MTLISKQTAMDIALAYREIEVAESLLNEVTDAIKKHEAPNLRDSFGRPQRGLELGVPSGPDSRRMFNVPWAICGPVIETHIAAQRAKLTLLTEKAKLEMSIIQEASDNDA